MALLSGDKLGPYEILSPIGAGGMGEVYKARDSRLERTVAIKVLPEHIAKREDLRARFEREARAVASLNHPHICVLYDIGNQDGVGGYMVLEHLEGETLEACLERGALPLDGALRYALQIADALDRAHRTGVTHRDIKPGNIMLTRDGVKVLDFGLSKSTAKPGPAEATIVKSLTTEGTVMGTPQYMAPEQFEGREADARSDIWAFGAVLYEMVTGRKAFEGKSYSSLLGAILSAEPAPMAVKPFTPGWLERLVRRCLHKDPEERWQSMRDVVLELKTPPLESTAAPTRTSRWPWVLAGVMTVVAMLGWGAWMRTSNAPALPLKFEVNPPEGGSFAAIFNAGGSAISPDGRTLAFVASAAKGGTLLHLRPLDSLQAQPLPGTEEAARPFWSPDGKSLAFVAQGKLKRIDLSGGVPITLCDAGQGRGGSWGEDGQILFADQRTGLKRIPASGGTPSAVTRLEAGENSHYYPQLLPGGKRFLYWVRSDTPEKTGIAIATFDGKPATLIVQTQHRGAYDVSSGRLLYIQGAGTLIAKKLVLDPPRLTGDPVTVAEGVGLASANRYAEFSVSHNGTLSYGRGNAQNVRFGWRDRSGKLMETMGQPIEPVLNFSLSPDGSRVAYGAQTDGSLADVWVFDLARGVRTRVTFNGGLSPQWSPDGKQLYYVSTTRGVYRKAADGSGEEEMLLKGGNASPNSVSSDGKLLLFYGPSDIMILPLTGERTPTAYLQTKYVEGGATFSPDGRWVAYHSNESGRLEIYVQGFPERRGKLLVSADGGTFAQWRADGKELYWIRQDGTLMAASVEIQAVAVRIGRAEALFRLPLGSLFQPSRDGRRFLVYEPEGGQREWPMVVVQNWAARLGK